MESYAESGLFWGLFFFFVYAGLAGVVTLPYSENFESGSLNTSVWTTILLSVQWSGRSLWNDGRVADVSVANVVLSACHGYVPLVETYNFECGVFAADLAVNPMVSCLLISDVQ
jgi:hypothetical protein